MKTKRIISIVTIAILGMSSIVLPVFFLDDLKHYDSPLFPLAAICEMIADSSSHNMFPIEFIFYGFYTIPAIIGAYTSQLIKSFVIKKK